MSASNKSDKVTKGKRRGPKVIEIDFDLIDGAISIGANMTQCLYILDTKGIKIDEKTLQRRIRQKFDMTYPEYKDYMMSSTKIKLVQTAIRKALEGNVVMMIFCLKNLCGWADKLEQTVDVEKNVVQLKYSLEDKK